MATTIRAFREAAIAKGAFVQPAHRVHELYAKMGAALRFLRKEGPTGDTASAESGCSRKRCNRRAAHYGGYFETAFRSARG